MSTLFYNNTAATVTSGGTTAPASGSTESWTVTGVSGFPAALGSGQQFHVADPLAFTEKVLVTSITGSGPYTWTVTRGDESTTPVAHASGFSINQVVTAGEIQAGNALVADYNIFLAGSTVLCTAAATGTIAYAGADAGAALNAAVTALASTGGTIMFRAGTYTWSSVVALPRGLPTWLKIIGEPGTTISLSSSGRRFCDFNRIAAGDTFQYIHIEGFTFDCTGINSLTGSQHIILGTFTLGTGNTTGIQINMDHITIRRCRILNAFNGATATAEQMSIYLLSYQNAASQPQNTVTNILIEEIEQTGGNYCVFVGGAPIGAPTTWDPNIFCDNIRIRDIKHDVGADPTGFDSYGHVQVGSRAVCGTVWIERVWGRGSMDVGIEVDNIKDLHMRDVYLRNIHGYGIAITNFLAPSDLNEQIYDISDVTFERNGGVWASGASSAIGVVESSSLQSVKQNFGKVRCRNVRVYVSAASLGDIVTTAVTGEFMTVKANVLEATLADSNYYATGYQQTSTTSNSFPSVIYVPLGTSPATTCKLTLRNLDIFFGAVNVGSAHPAAPTLIRLSSKLNIHLDGITMNCQVTTPGSFVTSMIGIGPDSGSNIAGTIRRLRIIGSNDTGTNGVLVSSSTTLTIPNAITVADCDFSGLSSAREMNVDATVKAKVYAFNNKWVTFPKVAYTDTAPASGTAQQYTDMWPARICLTATTSITAVTISKDNSSFFTVFPTGVSGTVTALSFDISQGDWYKVTYTGTLTVNVVPYN